MALDTAGRSTCRAIAVHWRTHAAPGTKWVHFNNIADWAPRTWTGRRPPNTFSTARVPGGSC